MQFIRLVNQFTIDDFCLVPVLVAILQTLSFLNININTCVILDSIDVGIYFINRFYYCTIQIGDVVNSKNTYITGNIFNK